MMFKLRDFDLIKNDIAQTEEILKTRDESNEHNKKFDGDRLNQFLFIQSIINELTNRRTTENPKTTLVYSAILYGAMLLIQKDIKDKLHMFQSSLLSDRLSTAMGITASQKPSNYQVAEYHRFCNQFLSVLFIDQDSRNGIYFDNPLKTVPIKDLIELVKKSYKLEHKFHNLAIDEMKAEATTKADLSKYSTSKKIPANLVKMLGDWDQIKESFEKIIVKELADKNVANIENLDLQRATQLQFLTQLKNILTSKEADKWCSEIKVSIFCGAMYLVRAQIAKEYGAEPFDNATRFPKLKNSIIHTAFSNMLLADDAVPEDIELLMQHVYQFLRFNTMDEVNKTPAFRVEHPFKAKALHVPKLFTLISDMCLECREVSLKQCEALALPKEPSQKSFFGNFFTASPKNPPKTSIQEELEAKMPLQKQ